MISHVLPQPSIFSSFSAQVSRLTPKHLFFPPAPPVAQKPLQQRAITPVSLSHLSQLSKEALNTNWNNLLQDVQKALIAQSGDRLDDTTKKELQQVFEHLSLDHLQQFLRHLPEWQLSKPDIPLSDLALEAMPLNKIDDIIKKLHPNDFSSIINFVLQEAKRLSPETHEPVQPEIKAQASHSNTIIINFLTTFGHILLRSFDIFNNPRPPDTVHEYYVLVIIYFHFFKIPYFVVIALAKFIVSPWNVLLASLVLLGITVASIHSYLKWLKPCPQQVGYCNTLESIVIPKVFCHKEELNIALDFLGVGKQANSRSVVFHGKPGVGKSQLMQVLAAKLNKKRVFNFGPALYGTSRTMTTFLEKVTTAINEVQGHENEVVFLLDEAGHSFDNDLFLLFKLLKDKHPKIQIIAAMNSDQWYELAKKDKALEQRFKPIETKGTSDAATWSILNQEAKEKYPRLPITCDGIDAIIEQSNKKGSQPRQGLHALEDLEKLAGSANQAKSDLDQAEYVLANLKAATERINHPANIPFSKEYYAHLDAIEKQESLILVMQEKQKQIEQKNQEVRNGLDLERFYLKQKNDALRRLAHPGSLSTEEKIQCQKRLMFTSFFAFQYMRRWLDEHKKNLTPGSLPLIDKDYVLQKLEAIQK